MKLKMVSTKFSVWAYLSCDELGEDLIDILLCAESDEEIPLSIANNGT